MDVKFDVFISHSTSDKNWCRDFAEGLRERGLRVFFDDWPAQATSPQEDTIRNGLRSSSSLVVVLDASSLSSQWAAFEVGAAIELNKLVVPVIAQDVSGRSVPKPLRAMQQLRMNSPNEVAERVADLVHSQKTAEAPDQLAELERKIRGEFLEMPGLRLTAAQAARLLGLDRDSSEALFGRLAAAKFLVRKPGGAFEQAREGATAQSSDELGELERIRGEFVEMPGLRLTAAQAARLWGLDSVSSEALLSKLADTGFLVRKPGGAFVQTRNAAAPQNSDRSTAARTKSSKR